MPPWLTTGLAFWGAGLSTILAFNQLMQNRPTLDIKAQVFDNIRLIFWIRIYNETNSSILIEKIDFAPKYFKLWALAEGKDQRSHHFSVVAAHEGRIARRLASASDEVFRIWRGPKNYLPREIKSSIWIFIFWRPGNGLMPVLPLVKRISAHEYDLIARAATMEPPYDEIALDPRTDQAGW